MLTGDLHSALRAQFGFGAFRPGQEAAISAVLAGRDALVVMPTGAGKSLCYQLPALLREDLTIVVSPLVSLMADQVRSLARQAPGVVAQVNAQQDARGNQAALAAALRGDVRVLHVAPERFSVPGFLRALGQIGVGLFVVDEAHCVSHWGHDFRPDYLRLGEVARTLGARAVLAMTATATPRAAEDIVARLGLRTPVRVVTGFDRPNLSFAVARCADGPARTREIASALAAAGATPAIVYAGTRGAVDALVEALEADLGRPVVGYHAGLSRDERARAQQAFMNGGAEVVVATTAFGMGIDKADVRTVIHAGVPESVEAYYQEAGRAGRDGAPARALLLAADRDRGLHAHFARRAAGAEAHVARVAEALQAAAGGPPADALPGLAGRPSGYDLGVAELGVPDPGHVRAVIGMLARVGMVEPEPAPPDRVRGRLLRAWGPDAARRGVALARDERRVRWDRHEAVWALVASRGCRRAALLAHFGDPAPPTADGPCCDVCAPELVAGIGSPAPPGRVELDVAIAALVAGADPPLDARAVAAVLRGARARWIRSRSLDGHPSFGTFGHHSEEAVVAAIDAMLAAGVLARAAGGPAARPADALLVAAPPLAAGRQAA